jgi:phosphatidylglycerophosphate synthase
MTQRKKKAARHAPRRQLATRGQAWARALARGLTKARVSPNAISVAGLVFALLGALSLALGRGAWPSLLAAAAFIQLRLLCNLMDGMVAIEGGLKAKDGELYNEVCDRPSDLVLLLGAGVAAGGAWGWTLGWAAATLAILTAYARVFGGSAGLPQDFCGPMAKQHRMALLTAACLLAAALAPRGLQGPVLSWALLLIVLGSLATFWRRLWRIRKALLSA